MAREQSRFQALIPEPDGHPGGNGWRPSFGRCRGWFFGQFALLVALASIACERFEPLAEVGIELPRFERQKGSFDRRHVVLNYTTGTYTGFEGFFLERSGEVWIYRNSEFSACATIRDEERKLDCLFERSVLAARLTPQLRDELIRAVELVDERDRVKRGDGCCDGGGARLERPAGAGGRIQIASCAAGSFSQLTSTRGQKITSFFGALRHAIPNFPAPTDCPWETKVTFVQPGVLAWWVTQKE